MKTARPTKAFVLAAGFGTRMLPLSRDLPKPLMPLWGRPILERILNLLRSWGVKEVVINLHHNPDEIFRARPGAHASGFQNQFFVRAGNPRNRRRAASRGMVSGRPAVLAHQLRHRRRSEAGRPAQGVRIPEMSCRGLAPSNPWTADRGNVQGSDHFFSKLHAGRERNLYVLRTAPRLAAHARLPAGKRVRRDHPRLRAGHEEGPFVSPACACPARSGRTSARRSSTSMRIGRKKGAARLPPSAAA